MKPIKKITLKDAKVLSDSELRNITGDILLMTENASEKAKVNVVESAMAMI